MIINVKNICLKNLVMKILKNVLIMKFSHLAITTSVMMNKSHFHIVNLFNKAALTILRHLKLIKISTTMIKIYLTIINKILNVIIK